MEDMISVKQAAMLWNLTPRRVAGLCKEGKIEGAVKQGHAWLIPSNAEKPFDNRVKTGVHRKSPAPAKLPLPIGVSNYRLATTDYYYVDKTMLIKDILDERPLVSLFTRPRRFGKTLNMDMLRTFFEMSEEDTSIYFQDKKIWKYGKKYRDYQGRYPVLFLTFKDCKFNTWRDTYAAIKKLLIQEAFRHTELKESPKCNDFEKDLFNNLLSGDISEVGLSGILQDLTAMLHKHYGIAPIIIIDEYDVPIQQGHVSGFYDEVVLFMRNLFSGGFKDNPHISFGFLTGILRVAKESIFSGLNNLAIHSVLDSKYSTYFGFTSDEVQEMARYYGVRDKFAEICEWYDGYRFGKTDIFNPWSVINYFNSGCEPRAYWQATGSNDIIGEIISVADRDVLDRLTSLVRGESFATYIDTGVIYPQIQRDPSTIYSFLLVAGYLKAIDTRLAFSGDLICEVSLPNKELFSVYKREILQQLSDVVPQSTALAIQESIYSGDGARLQALIQKLLLQSVSYYDTAGENFYHGFMLGLCALLGGTYMTSNRESGNGRYDIQLMPMDTKLPGILIELKSDNDSSPEELKKLSEQALQQIMDKGYDTEMRAKGVALIYRYGVAFSGKQVHISVA